MPKPSADNLTQRERFIETARQLGADEDEAAFKAKLAVIAIARQKPNDISEVREPDRKDGE